MSAMKLETLNAQGTKLPSTSGRRAGDEGAALPHEQTIAGFSLSSRERVGVRVRPLPNMAEILEA